MDYWKEEVEAVQSIFIEEMSVVEEESEGYLVKYNVQGDTVVTIRIAGKRIIDHVQLQKNILTMWHTQWQTWELFCYILTIFGWAIFAGV